MYRSKPVGAVLAAAAWTVAMAASAQPPRPNQPDTMLTAEVRTEVVDTMLKKLNENYIFADVAKKMEAAIRNRVKNHEYDAVTSSKTFAELLTTHLQEVSHDKHLRVRYSYETLPTRSNDQPTAQEIEQYRAYNRTVNYGFEKVERLAGNIGYIDLRGFMDPETGGDTVAAAMALLSNTDAMIIDLRQNGGGSPEMVQLICSYFFDGDPVHLNDLYYRPTDSTHQYWTLPHVPGKRYVGKDLYILTSSRTFSGAEEFSYNMKNLKRATVVGETTGGGAHPGGVERINDHFGVFLPVGRAINPITKTNWEGTGVTPDVACPSDHALKTAHIAAMRKVLGTVQDPDRKASIQGALESTQKELDALKAGKSS
jgi:retinol-binding protein 3